ncbi:aspartate--tRNA(Asn) ligase [Clostridium sp. MSJ-4]|uniref:Aspartate--tRNA ligase n=1 Tax=Clostridium simiarum TaxID=2841506 RepID=A0ABS6F0F4_9CLOT|nr:aspartate--tRNA(Asn) ligase [Clostridium simiarum]MBU5591977.1 aspartate--tRNA(Asn) ligase [Clostridium simiarum]
MKRILISELKEEFINEKVLIKGWVHRIRILKKVTFILVRDRSGVVQCVIDNESINNVELKNESVIEIVGKVVSSQNKISNIEVVVENINILSKVKDELPIEVNNGLDIKLETMLDNRVLSLRKENINFILKVKAILAQGFREFLIRDGFTEIFTPKIVKDGAEGGTNLFNLKYFENTAYLAQSPQFYKQMMVAAGYEKVFEIAHVYRAEEHDTRRHLNEYVSMDLEMGFIEDEKDIMRIENQLLIYLMEKLRLEMSEEEEKFEFHIPKVPETIPYITFKEAKQILKKHYNKINSEEDLDPQCEELIYEYAKTYLDSEFIFITDYPKSKRPMYAMPKGENLTHSFDLIFRGMEITTGGQRIHDYDMLVNNFINKGLDPSNFGSYTEIFKYGVPPHGGLAIGLERLTCQILGLKNVREASAFPRDRQRLLP